jgi:hypothetical protein
MGNRTGALVLGLLAVSVGSAYGQQCLHGPAETPEQAARRRDGLIATRTINTIQANQPGAANRSFLRQVDLAGAPSAAKMRESTNDTIKRISLNPNEEILPGWKLTLDVTENGYWFMIRDTTDLCGFAFVSNQDGLIFTAEPIR